MDIMAILGDAMDYNARMDVGDSEVEYDLNTPALIRSVYEKFEKPYTKGEQCAVILSKDDCEINGFRLWNSDTMESENVYLYETYTEINVPARYSYIYKIICRELVHGHD